MYFKDKNNGIIQAANSQQVARHSPSGHRIGLAHIPIRETDKHLLMFSLGLACLRKLRILPTWEYELAFVNAKVPSGEWLAFIIRPICAYSLRLGNIRSFW